MGELAKNDKCSYQPMYDELKEKLQLREKIIDSQRYQMEILKGRLKKKYWWKFWK